MFDYLNPFFGFDDTIVEKNTPKDLLKYYYSDIFYEYSPYLNLPDSLDEFREMHKSKFWYNIRRSYNLLKDDFEGLKFKVQFNEEAIYYLNDLRDIFLSKWENEYTSFCWKTEIGYNEFKSNVVNLIERGFLFEVGLLLDESEKTILAYSLGFHIDGVYYFFMHNVNPKYSKTQYNTGTVFLKYLIEENIKSKISTTFDFMLGTSEYKLKWTNQLKPIYWRVKTKKCWYFLPVHLCKILVFNVKIFLQKNYFCNKNLKRVFFFLDSILVFKNLIRFLERRLFRM